MASVRSGRRTEEAPAPLAVTSPSASDVEMLPTRLDEQLCFSLYAATNTMTRAYRPLLREIGLTYPQYLVLLALWDDDGIPTRHIADRLELPANALSPLLDRLEGNGLVTRRPDDHDRRVHRVHLTDAGHDLRSAVAATQDAVAGTTRLTPDEHRLLRDLLRRLFTDTPPPDAGDGTGGRPS